MGSDDDMGSDMVIWGRMMGPFWGCTDLGLFGSVLLMGVVRFGREFYMMGWVPCLTVAAVDQGRFPIPRVMLLGVVFAWFSDRQAG
jgi:hypothetical protein